MPSAFTFSRALVAVAFALASMQAARAQAPIGNPIEKQPDSTVSNSPLDAPMFYQLLVGELELRTGKPGNAYQVLLDAARKTRDEALFRRAVEVALQERAGDTALQATQAWRNALPNSLEAIRYQLQLLIGLDKLDDTVEPMRSLIKLTPMAERPAVISSLPRLFDRGTDKTQSAKRLEQVLQPSASAPETKVPAQVAMGRAWLAAGNSQKALELARSAHALDPNSEAAALLGLELMLTTPAAESIVSAHLQAKPTSTSIRMVYARILSGAQRYADAVPQLEAVIAGANPPASAWLTLGALHLELKHPAEATAVLNQYLQKLQSGGVAPTAPDTDTDDDDDDPATPDQGPIQAYLLLSQAAEQQRNFALAESWLTKIKNPQRALDVQIRRASLLAKQGKLKEARELIRRAPEKTAEDARAKVLAEAQLLRDAKQWNDASVLLVSANQKYPDDADLLYEQSMMSEKLNRMDEMERLLRRVIAIKPDHHHAYNALGYSLAERNLRLPEARDLIKQALVLAPGEPFITDSLGWVEYRLGNREEALRLLEQAYRSRPDVEIGAHFGEVLWTSGRQDDARRVLREARRKDASNEVLKETLTRLRVDL